ncbi:MAG: NAD-dependent protein deacylase [Clostridiales bacterium]|nr:NAD-dependent protein deacylase [Clostridiales bacterium]
MERKAIMDDIQKLKEMIGKSENIVFFGGAGVSTESGIPDFRSRDGLYNQKNEYDFDPEYLLSIDCFQDKPEIFWKFYRDKILIDGVEPNDAHRALAKLEQDGKLRAVVTQNIDNLHELGGSKTVYHIHGSVLENHCPACGKAYTLQDIQNMLEVPHCSCGAVIKPDVTLYGELLPEDAWQGATQSIRKADMLIIAGTSLQVNPAASLVTYFAGDSLVIINRTPTEKDKWADLVLRESVGKVMRKAVLD